MRQESATATAAQVTELLAHDSYLTSLGIRCIDGESGDAGARRPVFVLDPLDRHVAVPVTGVLHGGVVAAFLEAAATLHLRCASGTDGRADGGADLGAVEFSTDLLRPLPLATVYARVDVLRRGRRFASVRVDAWQDRHDRLVATGHGRFVLEPSRRVQS